MLLLYFQMREMIMKFWHMMMIDSPYTLNGMLIAMADPAVYMKIIVYKNRLENIPNYLTYLNILTDSSESLDGST